jgi:hypothetical protein
VNAARGRGGQDFGFVYNFVFGSGFFKNASILYRYERVVVRFIDSCGAINNVRPAWMLLGWQLADDTMPDQFYRY